MNKQIAGLIFLVFHTFQLANVGKISKKKSYLCIYVLGCTVYNRFGVD